MTEGQKYEIWQLKHHGEVRNLEMVQEVLLNNRGFTPIDKLEYGDYGIQKVASVIEDALAKNKKIALYADYDVDGTMSCVSWIWFFRAIGFSNFEYHIPCRFKEGYGVNKAAVKKLIDKGAQVIITMDTGITANEEAAYCRSRGVDFICTDHHVIQKDKMPDSLILNPKMHPDAMYQEMCGCGITFVLLRTLGKKHKLPANVWSDLLALCGMATICDVVPLNGVNHKLAKMGVRALVQSQHPVLKKLKKAAGSDVELDEFDVGFRLGPRINAVGRLEHAHLVVQAFVDDDCDPLIEMMGTLNETRKEIQKKIVEEAIVMAETQLDQPILFLGGDWHIGVVGIAASKIAEKYWRPTWLFNRGEAFCKGSARSIPGFDVTKASLVGTAGLFDKCGGHEAAAGFSFTPEKENELRASLVNYASQIQKSTPKLWQSQLKIDGALSTDALRLGLLEVFDDLKPFGNGFESPVFKIEVLVKDIKHYKNKHTAVIFDSGYQKNLKVMFFNEVIEGFTIGGKHQFVVSINKNIFKGQTNLNLIGLDYC